MPIEAMPGNLPDREFSFSRQSKLSAAVYGKKVYHWDTAFRKVHDIKDPFIYKIAPHLGDLLDFQRYILAEQQKAIKKTTQEVIVLPKLSGTLELPIMINGAPILLVHPRMRFVMEGLLSGVSEYRDELVGMGVTSLDIKADMDFLDKWRLGLALVEEDEADRKKYSLYVPETTKVVIG